MTANDCSDFIKTDLAKSGLSPEDMQVKPLESEKQLYEHLGFSKLGDIGLLDVGGYFIEYPNDPKYNRLKLRKPVEDCKYLSPLKNKGFGNKPYILSSVLELCKDYKPDKPIIFTEGEKKTACAVKLSFPTIGLSGVWNFKDSENDLLPELSKLNFKHRKCFICFDSDITSKINVRRAELRLVVELYNRDAIPLCVRLPNEPDGEKNGLDDFLVRYNVEKFQELLKNELNPIDLHLAEGTPKDILLKEVGRIKPEIIREAAVKKIATHLKIKSELVRKEIDKYRSTDESAKNEEKPSFTDEEIKAAKKLLQRSALLKFILRALRTSGYVGEEINKLLLYLSFSSRLLDDSISTIVKGASSSGKSSLVHSVLKLFPEDVVKKFSIITPRALVHSTIDLSHKILVIEEKHGSDNADYPLRTIQSEKELSIALPIKNESTGDFETIEKKVRAEGLVTCQTTTKEYLHPENQTRLFDLYMDESAEQTERVLFAEAEDTKPYNSQVAIRILQAAQTLLEQKEVFIPFAKELVTDFPKDNVRVRRDFKRFLSLIKSHALLFQFQRKTNENGQIITTLDDLKAILPLAEIVLSQSIQTLSPKQLKVLDLIQSDFSNKEFSTKDLDRISNVVSYRTLQRYLTFFSKEGILSWNGESGTHSRYNLIDPVTSCRNTSIVSPNTLQSLDNTYKNPRQTRLTSSDVIDVTKGDYDNDDNTRQNGLTSSKSNDYNDLTHKNPTDVTGY